MIRVLRRRHLWMVGILAVAVLALFVAALAVRPELPVNQRLPPLLEASPE